MANIFGDIIAVLGLHVHTIDHLEITDTSTQVVFTILVSYVILCLWYYSRKALWFVEVVPYSHKRLKDFFLFTGEPVLSRQHLFSHSLGVEESFYFYCCRCVLSRLTVLKGYDNPEYRVFTEHSFCSTIGNPVLISGQ